MTGVWFPVGARDFFLFSVASRPALGHNQPSILSRPCGHFPWRYFTKCQNAFRFFFSSDFMSGSLRSSLSFRTQITEEDLFYKHVRLKFHTSWCFHVTGREYGQMGHLQIHTCNYRGHVLIGATPMGRDAFSLLYRISMRSPLARYRSRQGGLHLSVIQSAHIKIWPPISLMLSQTNCLSLRVLTYKQISGYLSNKFNQLPGRHMTQKPLPKQKFPKDCLIFVLKC
jgi:hypothetical protein